MKKLGEEIKHIREDVLRMSQEEFAHGLGMHRRTVQEWEYGTNHPMGGTLFFIRHLKKCLDAQEHFKKLALSLG
jgi:DNA-binding transcriptional regulator YiaG